MLEHLIVASGGLPAAERAALTLEFPTVKIGDDAIVEDWGPIVDAAAWADPSMDPRLLDDAVAEAAREGSFSLRIAGSGGDGAGLLTRYQRFLGRRNFASASPVFDHILDAHRALHDLDRPLCRADHDHALDTWQWLLRLSPQATLALQAAALFHDVERLESEAGERVEHRAPSYQDFKEAHARRGATIACAALAGTDVDAATLARIGELIEGHERPSADPEGALLNDADALSFFSLNSSGFLDYYGAEHTRRKVAYTLRRLRPESLGRLPRIRLRPEVAALVTAFQSTMQG